MKILFEKICNGNEKLSVIGLGYVGLPLAVAFSKVLNVVGFDLNNKKIEKYKLGIDITNEIGNEALMKSEIFFTNIIYYLFSLSGFNKSSGFENYINRIKIRYKFH